MRQLSPSADKTANDASDKDVLSGAATAPAKETANRLTAFQSEKETSNLQVLAVRTGKAVEEQMESIKEKLNEIVNSYPPFLRGSEKRQQYLMSISSIRQQIEAMTVPPNTLDTPSLSAASNNEAKKVWANLFQNIGIPELEANGPNEASDAQIKAASSLVETAQSDLSSRRATLEQQLAQPAPISSPIAQYMSQTAVQGLSETDLSLTSNLTGALRNL